MERNDVKALIDAGYPFDFDMGRTVASWWDHIPPMEELDKEGKVSDKEQLLSGIYDAMSALDDRELAEDDFTFNMIALIRMLYWIKREC